jgi:hypothetical protein
MMRGHRTSGSASLPRLADGRRVILHDDRGFIIGMGSGGDSLQDGLTVDSVIRWLVGDRLTE